MKSDIELRDYTRDFHRSLVDARISLMSNRLALLHLSLLNVDDLAQTLGIALDDLGFYDDTKNKDLYDSFLRELRSLSEMLFEVIKAKLLTDDTLDDTLRVIDRLLSSVKDSFHMFFLRVMLFLYLLEDEECKGLLEDKCHEIRSEIKALIQF